MTEELSESPAELAEAPKREPIVPYPDAYIERVLWVCALKGGSVTATRRQLLEENFTFEGSAPSTSTIDRWVKTSWRNKYHEILQMKAHQFDDVLAADASVLAAQITEAERRAVKQVLRGLNGANALESSQILRNLSQSKGVNMDKAAMIRERPVKARRDANLAEIVRQMKRIGTGQVVQVVEGSAEEVGAVGALPVEADVVPEGLQGGLDGLDSGMVDASGGGESAHVNGEPVHQPDQVGGGLSGDVGFRPAPGGTGMEGENELRNLLTLVAKGDVSVAAALDVVRDELPALGKGSGGDDVAAADDLITGVEIADEREVGVAVDPAFESVG
jgi:hypothetical protein